jgi:hypothetical protein
VYACKVFPLIGCNGKVNLPALSFPNQQMASAPTHEPVISHQLMVVESPVAMWHRDKPGEKPLHAQIALPAAFVETMRPKDVSIMRLTHLYNH